MRRPRISMALACGRATAAACASLPTRTRSPRLEAPTSMLPFSMKHTPPNMRCSVKGASARAARTRATSGSSTIMVSLEMPPHTSTPVVARFKGGAAGGDRRDSLGSVMPTDQPDAPAPAIILVEPQLGENIGTAARAMANLGLTDLRLVAPRDGWPNERARVAASRADHVIDGVRIFATAEAAVADLNFVLATTARMRDLPKRVIGPREAAADVKARAAGGQAS